MNTSATDHLLFIFATCGGWIHVLDEVIFVRSPVYGALALAVLNLIAVATYPRLGPWRALISIGFGIAWSYGGLATHLLPMLTRGPVAGDATGTLAELPAGLLFIALGVRLVLKRRLAAL